MRSVIAILVSDIHLAHTPPLCRQGEDDWYAVMDRQLAELKSLANSYKVPIICAGDVFDKWNPPCQLIEFAIENLPSMYAVPGQHDLAYHSYSSRYRTGYGVLEAANIITNIPPNDPLRIGGMFLHGFPWGFEIQENRITTNTRVLNVAVVHDYIWTDGAKYTTAPRSKNYKRLKPLDYDAFVFGDNHQGFIEIIKGKPTRYLANNGTFFRRRSNEIEYMPFVTLLHSDGKMTRHNLESCRHDKVCADKAVEKLERLFEVDAGDLVADLADLKAEHFDFVVALDQFCKANDIDKDVARIVREAVADEGRT